MSAKKILVVEDDPVYQQRLCDILRQTGAELLVAADGQQGVTLAEQEHPDLVFMDIVMPGIDGFSACRQITTGDTTKHIPVIIVSSKHEEADRVWAQLQGATAIVAKPFTDQDILDQVTAHG